MATAGALITDALTRLSDVSGDRWARSELLGYLNYGLKEYARRTKSFRRITRLETGQEPDLFELPNDTVAVYFVEYNDKSLSASSWRELEAEDPYFTTRTGTPERWYQDVSAIHQLRVWPIPTDNDEDEGYFIAANKGGSTGETGTPVVIQLDGVDATVSPVTPPDNAEWGAIVQILDSDGSDDFFASTTTLPWEQPQAGGEEGSIVFCAASKLRIGYCYVPPPITSEMTEVALPDQLEEGMIHFLMVRAYEKDGETRELQKAKYFRELFEQAVAEATRRAEEGFASRVRYVEGYWL